MSRFCTSASRVDTFFHPRRYFCEFSPYFSRIVFREVETRTMKSGEASVNRAASSLLDRVDRRLAMSFISTKKALSSYYWIFLRVEVNKQRQVKAGPFFSGVKQTLILSSKRATPAS